MKTVFTKHFKKTRDFSNRKKNRSKFSHRNFSN